MYYINNQKKISYLKKNYIKIYKKNKYLYFIMKKIKKYTIIDLYLFLLSNHNKS